MRAPFIATGVAALALATWLLSPHGERSQKAPAARAPTAHHDGTDEKLAVMSAEIASLKAELTARRHPPSALTAAPEAPPAAQEHGHADEAPRPARRTPDELVHGLEQHLGSDGKDAAWSARAEATIATAFHGNALKGSRLLHAECGTTMCRVDVSHESTAAQSDFLGGARLVPPFNQEGFARRVNDPESGTSKTVVYISREGHTLPRLDDG